MIKWGRNREPSNGFLCGEGNRTKHGFLGNRIPFHIALSWRHCRDVCFNIKLSIYLRDLDSRVRREWENRWLEFNRCIIWGCFYDVSQIIYEQALRSMNPRVWSSERESAELSDFMLIGKWWNAVLHMSQWTICKRFRRFDLPTLIDR